MYSHRNRFIYKVFSTHKEKERDIFRARDLERVTFAHTYFLKSRIVNQSDFVFLFYFFLSLR